MNKKGNVTLASGAFALLTAFISLAFTSAWVFGIAVQYPLFTNVGEWGLGLFTLYLILWERL